MTGASPNAAFNACERDPCGLCPVEFPDNLDVEERKDTPSGTKRDARLRRSDRQAALRCSEQIAHSLLFCGARTNQEFAQQSLAIKSSNLNVDNLWRQNRRHRVGFASVAPDRSDVPLNIRDVNDDEDAVWKRLTDGEIARLKGPVVTRATGLRGAAQVGGAGKTVHRRLSAAWSLSGVGRSAPCGVAPTSAGKSHFPITVQKRAAARQADDHQSALDRS